VRHQRTGSTTVRKCEIENCDRPFHAKGLCDRHYRMSRHGKLAV
jgi:hypothetical protein